MTMPPDDRDDRPDGPWSQPPRYPPPDRPGGYSNEPPGYTQPGYPEPGYPHPGQPGYPEPGYPEPGYPGRDYPHPGQPGHPPSGHRASRRTTGTTRTSAAPPATRARKSAGAASTSAFTGLVLGILGLLGSFLAPILAIVFGVLGLTRARRTGRRGAAMAVTAILLGVMWIALTGLFTVLVIHNDSYGSVAALSAGSCFDNAQPGHVAVRVHYLPSCTQPHNGEVVGTFALPGAAWPGQQTVSREASAGCAQLLTSVLGQKALSSGVRGMNYYPSQQAWSTGTRAVSCVLLDPNATHTGSMLAGS